MKIAKANTPPMESGWYLIKDKESDTWEQLVHVIGDAPFLSYLHGNTRQLTNRICYIFSDISKNDYSEKLDLNV